MNALTHTCSKSRNTLVTNLSDSMGMCCSWMRWTASERRSRNSYNVIVNVVPVVMLGSIHLTDKHLHHHNHHQDHIARNNNSLVEIIAITINTAHPSSVYQTNNTSSRSKTWCMKGHLYVLHDVNASYVNVLRGIVSDQQTLDMCRATRNINRSNIHNIHISKTHLRQQNKIINIKISTNKEKINHVKKIERQ